MELRDQIAGQKSAAKKNTQNSPREFIDAQHFNDIPRTFAFIYIPVQIFEHLHTNVSGRWAVWRPVGRLSAVCCAINP